MQVIHGYIQLRQSENSLDFVGFLWKWPFPSEDYLFFFTSHCILTRFSLNSYSILLDFSENCHFPREDHGRFHIFLHFSLESHSILTHFSLNPYSILLDFNENGHFPQGRPWEISYFSSLLMGCSLNSFSIFAQPDRKCLIMTFSSRKRMEITFALCHKLILIFTVSILLWKSQFSLFENLDSPLFDPCHSYCTGCSKSPPKRKIKLE